MGTSTSSTGPGPGIPLVPPWVPDPEPPIPPPDAQEGEDTDSQDHTDSQDQEVTPAPSVAADTTPIPTAPFARFRGARVNLGNFAHTGSTVYMRRGLGHYVRSGYGGSHTATRRMGGTTRTAGVLYGTLSSVAGQAEATHRSLSLILLAGRSADEIMDALVDAIRPIDGTQDSEAARSSIRDALSELLGRFPDADLLNLTEDQRLYVIEQYLALDVYRRFALDLSKTVQDKAPSAITALSRLKEVKDYIKQTVLAQFRKLGKVGEQLDARHISEIARQSLHNTFIVFEEYVT